MKPAVFIFLIFGCLFSRKAIAQINDCEDAQVICSSETLAFNPIGPGEDDFADPDNDPGCITALEQNSAWYYFQIDPNAPLGLQIGFIINPLGGFGEDYDWALYGPNVVCGDLGSPVRCSSSSAQCGFCPETGMGMGTTDFTEGPGTGDGFVAIMTVLPGQGYYLLIDNWLGTNNGFTLTWTESAAPWLNCNASPPCALEALAGIDINACEGDEFTLNGESNGSHGNESYSWIGTNGGTNFLDDPDIPNPTVTLPQGFNGSITYTLTVIEDTCMSEDVIELTVNPLPDIEINPAGPFCPDDPPYTLTATPPGGMWGGDASGNTFNPVANGPGIHTVTYTYTDANDCMSIEEMDIEVHEPPDVIIDPEPAEFCDNENSVLLTATGSGGAPGYTYHWNTPAGMADGSTFDAMLAGLYSVTVTDENGCIGTTTTTVITYPNPDAEIVDPGPICVTLANFTVTANPPGGEFDGTIIDPSGEIYPNMNAPGVYLITYTYTDVNGCEGTDNINITIIAVPEAIATNNSPLCEGQPIQLNGETNVTSGNISYQWTGPGGYTSNVQNPTNATLAGNYLLQVFHEGCPSAVAVTTVSLFDAPDAVADNGGPYCFGETIQLLGSTTATGTIIYAWSGPNGYTSNAQNPTDATEAGVYTLIITANNCSSPMVQTEVIFSAPPDASATNTGPYCQGEVIALFGNTSATGNMISYTWSGPLGYQSSAQNPIDAQAPGVYQLIIEVDGCQSTPVMTNVVVNPSPQPDITGQAAFCTGNSATMDAGSGFMSYLWNDGSQTQMLEVFSSGTYHVTVTSANGCTGIDSFEVIENTSLSPVIMGTLSFCEGFSTLLDAGTGYATYEWSTGETTQTISVMDGGNYGVIVTDADGCSGSTTVTAIENPNPNVTIGGSTTFCIGGSTVLDAGAGYAQYTWSDNSTNQTIIVSIPGTYTVDVVDINGCTGSASVMIEESTSLNPVITGLEAFCENGSTTLNAGTGFATYLWSDGSTGQLLVVNVAGTYSVTVSDGGSCSGEAMVTVMEVLPPVAVVQASETICNTQAGGSIINLYDLILSGDNTGSWQDIDNSGAVGFFNNLDFDGIAAGDYRFIYTTNSAIVPCPESTYEVVITVLECTCPDVLFFSAGPLCNAGDVLDLSTIENTTEPGDWSILQNPPGVNPATLNGTLFDATDGDPGDYILQFSLQNQPPPGCPLDYQVSIQVDPSVDAGIAMPPVSYCAQDNQVVNLNSLITGADPNGEWSETSTQQSQGGAFNPVNGTFATNNQLPGTYTFEYALQIKGVCPDDASEVSVVIHPLPIATIADNVVIDCKNPTQSLDASGSSMGAEFDIEWTGPGIVSDGNENTLHPTIDQQGTYTLVITNTITGCTNSDEVTVIANTDAPTGAFIDSHNPSCFGNLDGYIHIEQVTGGDPPYLYSLNNGTFGPNPNFEQLPAGDHTVMVEDANGCRWDTLIVISSPSEIDIQLGPDIEIVLGESAIVQAEISISLSQLDTLLWDPSEIIECIDFDCLEATVNTFNTVILTATVIDLDGCRDSDELTILVLKKRKLYIPTIFSPNGDGINDRFFISGDDIQIISIHNFRIFDRWGDAIYEALNIRPNDESKGWDGHYQNQSLNPGVFTFVAEIEYIDGIVEVVTGDITLVK